MKGKKKLITWLLLAVFMMTVGVAVTLLATGCGEATEIDRPTVGTTSFVYNGAEQGITIAANDGYTVSGNQKSTDAGEYNVTVSLKDKEKTKWKGAGTDDLTFTYTIAKADNAFTTEYAVADYTVGSTPSVTDAVAKFGTATVGYYADVECKDPIAGMTGFTATTAAGTYYVKVSVGGTDNYNELSKVYTVVVSKAEVVKPTVGETSFVYNGEAQGISIAENDAYTIGGDQKATDAGTYTVTVSLKDKTTRQWSGGGTDDLTFTYEIAQAEVTKPSATENTFVYDGNEHNIVVPESDLYTVTSAAKTDKGEYSATVALKDKNNYKWAGGDSADLTLAWTISAVANGWIAEYNTDDYTYGQTPATTAADAKFGDAVVKFYRDEACSDEIAGMTGFDEQTAAGTYYVKVTVAGNENYGALSQVYTVIVAKAEVEKPTVGNASFVYNGKAQGISIAASGLYTVDGEQTKTDAGKYSVTVALNDKDNYKWTGGDSADLAFDYTIAKATVDRPSVATTSLAYNGAEQSVFTAPADAEYTVVGNTAKSVGKHTATFTLKDTRNYEWAGGSIGEFVVEWTIARGTATVTDESELNDAIADDGYDVITLGADIEIGKDSVVIARDMVIDLGGHTVTATSDKAAFNVNAGNVELRNGRIVCTNTDPNLAPRLVQVTAGTSKLTMNKIDAVSTGYGIGVFTNANLELNDCNIEVEWQVIATNNQTGGAKIVVNDSTLTSRNDAAIYMSCDTDLTLTDSAVTGTTAVDFRVGKLSVVGGSLTATSAHKKMAYADITNANGTYDAGEGSAILVRGNFYYDNVTKSNRASISVSGTQINGALSVYDMNDVGKMLGGKENVIDQIDALADFFTNFTGDKYFYEVANNNVTEGTIVATAEQLKAAVNDVRYGIVRLAADISTDVVVNASTNAVLDLNGYTLTNVSGHTVTNNGTLTVTDTSGAKSGVIDNVTHAKAAVLNNVGGTFTLAAGTLTRSKENGQSTTVSGGNSFYVLQNFGTATITGGAVTQDGHYSSLIENGWYDGSKNTAENIARLTISGGTFSGGLNTVKNDDWGDLTIRGGEFTNNSQAAVMNWNIAEISGGKFTVADGAQAIIVNGYANDTMDKGQLTVTGGEFAGAAIFATHSAATNGGTITVNSAVLRDAALQAVNATVVYEHEGVKSAYVYDGNSLKAALGGDCDTIVLTADIERTGGLRIQRSVVIDFNGHTYTLNSASEKRNLTAFGVDTNDNADIAVEFKNGTLESNNRGIYTDSGRVTLTDMKINAIGRALTVQETANVTIGAGSVLTANEIETVYIFGSKKDAATAAKFKPTLNIYGTVINTSADFGAIQGVGDDLSYSVINVYDGAEIAAKGNGDTPGIYQPQTGEINVYGGTITGYSAIGIKSGKLNVTGGMLVGSGALVDIATNGNGIDLDGSVIVVDSNGAYGGEIEITVGGGSLVSEHAYGIREIGKTDDATSIVSLNITGGEIAGAAGNAVINVREITKSKISVSGGTFSADVNEYCAEGVACVRNADGTYGIVNATKETAAIVNAIVSADSNGDKEFIYDTTDENDLPVTRKYTFTLVEFSDMTMTEEIRMELWTLDLFEPVKNVVVTVGSGEDKWYVITGDYNFTDDYLFGNKLYSGNNTVINNFPFE